MRWNSTLWIALSLCTVWVCRPIHAQPKDTQRIVTVAQSGEADVLGRSHAEIVKAIQDVLKAGGGTVRIKEGTYLIGETIRLGPEVKDVVIEGVGEAILKLAPQIRTVTTADLKAGDAVLKVQDASRFRPGMQIEIQAPGRISKFKGHQVKSFCMVVKSVSADGIEFTKPTKYAAPAGTNVVYLLNLFHIDRAKRVTFRRLVLDGGIAEGDIRPINHVKHCAIFGHGPYSYTEGPTGPPAEDIRVEECAIRNFFHRGIAFYSVLRAEVVKCRIENTQSEAIDFDHFCTHCVASENAIANAPIGVELNDASYCRIERNEIRDCNIGVNIWQWCKLDDLNVENTILQNRIANARSYGIRCAKRADRNRIEQNTVAGSKSFGIVLEGKANVARQNKVTGAMKSPFYVTGESNEVSENVCEDTGAKPGTVDAVFVTGTGNTIRRNRIVCTREKAFRHGICAKGSTNTIEENACDGTTGEPVKVDGER